MSELLGMQRKGRMDLRSIEGVELIGFGKQWDEKFWER